MVSSAVLIGACILPALCSDTSRRSQSLLQLQGTWTFRSVEWMGERTEQFSPPELGKAWDYLNLPAELRGIDVDHHRDVTTLTLAGNRYVWRAG
jgi:hypothetical protein